MTDRDALLAAIIAAPDEDVPRLAFADCIEEDGEGDRAEFIRAHIESDRLCRRPAKGGYAVGLRNPRGKQLSERANELLGQFEPQWFPYPHTYVHFDRGFAHRVRLSASDWIAHADDILCKHPIRSVALTTPLPYEHNQITRPIHVRLPGRRWRSEAEVNAAHAKWFRGHPYWYGLLAIEWPTVKGWDIQIEPTYTVTFSTVPHYFTGQPSILMHVSRRG